jgi:hypothetical protein
MIELVDAGATDIGPNVTVVPSPVNELRTNSDVFGARPRYAIYFPNAFLAIHDSL